MKEKYRNDGRKNRNREGKTRRNNDMTGSGERRRVR